MRVTFAPPAGLELESRHAALPDGRSARRSRRRIFSTSWTARRSCRTSCMSTFTVRERRRRPHVPARRRTRTASQADVDALATLVAAARARRDGRLRRVPDVRARALHVPARLRAAGLTATRWSIATARRSRRRAVARDRRTAGTQALDTISHEFFHVWNVERIRPAGLEPFDFTRENVTCCLWLAEGFTQYYGPLLLARAGLAEHVAARLAARRGDQPPRHAPCDRPCR